MTTEKDNIEQTETTDSEEDVSATETKVEPEVDLVEEVAKTLPDATATDEVPPQFLTKEDLDRVLEERKTAFDNAQGRAQQYTNQKVQEIQDGAKAQINEFMTTFSSILDEDQKEILEEKIQERERKAKEEKLDRLLENMDNPQSQGSSLTPENLEDLDAVVRDTASTLGLSVDVRNDANVWKGWNNSMTFSQSVKLANQNLKNLASTKKVAASEPAAQKVPPTTQGAPTQPKRAYRNLTDLSSAFANGQVDATQYRKLKKDL
jgi:glutamate synthase domain-containing protein 3